MSRRPIAIAISLLIAAPAASEARATLTLGLSSAAVVWSSPVTVRGIADPPVADEPISVTVGGTSVGTTATAGDGSFALRFIAHRGGDVLAQIVGVGATSATLTLAVSPRVTVRVSKRYAWFGSRVRVTVRPSTWAGAITARVTRGGASVGSIVRTAVRQGRASFPISSPGIGRFLVSVAVPAQGALAPRTVTTRFATYGRPLTVGSTGRDVHELLRRLERLGFHTPGVVSTLTRDATDAVVAFQKAYGLPRTYVFGDRDWRRLMHPYRLRARHPERGTHLEIDKTRQVLLIVRNGTVRHVIAVSTGATGNTPEGRWKILWRAPQTRTWLGSATLWWTMTFHGNFAIHGFAPVPPYPASHGCTREPIWASNWVYRRSTIGEVVYVYR